MLIVLAAALGALLGALVGLVGGGGGILVVPALVYLLGLPVAAAVPASLLVVGSAAAVAVIPRARRDVNWRLAAVVGLSGAPTAVAGGLLNRRLDQDVLLLALAAVTVAAGVRMLLPVAEVGGVCDRLDGGVSWRRCLPRAAATGLVVGLLTGLLGVGGGFLLVPALVIALGLRAATAIATSLVVIVANATAGLVPYVLAGRVVGGPDAGVVAAFALAAVLCSLPAERLARRLPASALRRGFGLLVLAVAVGVGLQAGLALT